MADSARPRLEVPQINVIRTLAMLAIFWHHLWNGLPKDQDIGIIGQFLGFLFGYGGLGVIIFNIISGFVLALPYFGPVGPGKPAPGYREFLRRRFLRICPQYYIALVLFILINAVITGNRDFWAIASSILERMLFLHTLDYDAFMTNIAAFWWLGLLAQFYFLFPLLVRYFRKLGPCPAFLSICAACWLGLWGLSRMVGLHPGSAWGTVNSLIYFNLPARLPEFALGVWMAASWRPSPKAALPFSRAFKTWTGAALAFVVLGGAFLVPIKTLPLALLYQIACCFSLFLLLFVLPSMAALGRRAVVADFAVASYSIYLIHQPILSYGNMLLGDRLGTMGQFILLTVAGGIVCYAGAKLLDRLAAGMFGGRRQPAATAVPNKAA